MLNLQTMIESNIEYFWDTDPSIWCDDGGRYKETPTIINKSNVEKIWEYFKDWCLMDCKETCEYENEYIKESVIIEAINNNYDNWLNRQRKLHHSKVCV